MGAPAIETCKLTRRFGRTLAVDGIDLSAPQGAVYGFLGRNGAGKTTTLKMILGLLRPDAGEIRVCGHDVAFERRKAARLTGALLEAHGFYGNLTGFENLDLTRRLLGLKPAAIGEALEITSMTGAAKPLSLGAKKGK